MKKTFRVFWALLIVGVAVTAGYIWGRRDGLTAEQNNLLTISSTTALLIRENRSDLVLRSAEQQINHAALGLKEAHGVPSPVAVYKDICTRYAYHSIPFQRSSEYINLYPHPNVSVQAVAYIEAQPDAEHSKAQ